MTSIEQDGYFFAVKMAIETAAYPDSSRWYEGMAYGLHAYACVVDHEKWRIDACRIREARKACGEETWKTTAG